MRLIDANALLEDVKRWINSIDGDETIIDIITNAPTIQRDGRVSIEGKVGTFCTVHQADKSKCQLHNLHCAYPSCCTAA